MDDALAVAEHDVFLLGAEIDGQLGAGDAGGAGAVDDDADILELFADELQGVDQSGRGDDGGAVLIVMENRDVEDLLELLLDVEALGPLDVLQVDAAEGRFEQLDGADQLVGILGVEFDVENIDVGKALEQNPFSFHNRFAGHGADVAESENRRAVGYDSHQVALGGIVVSRVRILLDLQAGFGNAGAVGQGQVAACGAGLGGDDLDLSLSSGTVVIKGLLALRHNHFLQISMVFRVSAVRRSSDKTLF